jgi:hypothetical protein
MLYILMQQGYMLIRTKSVGLVDVVITTRQMYGHATAVVVVETSV